MDKCQHEWKYERTERGFYAICKLCGEGHNDDAIYDKWIWQGQRIKALEDENELLIKAHQEQFFASDYCYMCNSHGEEETCPGCHPEALAQEDK